MEDGRGGVAAVVGNPYASVLAVHADALGIPVGEPADVVGGEQLGGVPVEEVDGVAQVLGFVLVGVGVDHPEPVVLLVIVESGYFRDGGGHVPEALLPEFSAVERVFPQGGSGLGAEVQVALVPGDALDSGVAHACSLRDIPERGLGRVGRHQGIHPLGLDSHVHGAGGRVHAEPFHVGVVGPLLREASVEPYPVQGAVVADAPEEVAVLAQAQAGEFFNDLGAVLQFLGELDLAHHGQRDRSLGHVFFRTLVLSGSVGIPLHGMLHGMAESALVVVFAVLPDHGAEHVPRLEVVDLGVHRLDVLVAGVHPAERVGQVGNLGHVVPDAVVLAGDVLAVADSLEEDVVEVAVVDGAGIPVADADLVAVPVSVERDAEVHHLVGYALVGVEDFVDDHGVGAVVHDGARAVEGRVVVRHVAFVVGHDVYVVDIRQHAGVVGVLAAAGCSVGEDLVGHGLPHLLEQGDEVRPVGRVGAVHVGAVLGRIGGILPVYVEAVGAVLLADGDAFVDEGLALGVVAAHLRPAVGVLAPSAHLELDLELRIVGLVGDELPGQRLGLLGDFYADAVDLVLEAHVAHVDVGEVAHFLK